jgi:predicted DNA-binding transcriptional regulator YafY
MTGSVDKTVRHDVEHGINQKRVLEIRYKDDRYRLVEPLYTFVSKEDVELVLTWQVAGYHFDGQLPDFRSFHLFEIKEAKILESHFEPPPHHKDKLAALEPVKVLVSITD